MDASQGVSSLGDLADRHYRGDAGLQGIASSAHSHPFNLGYDSSSSTSPVSSIASSSPTYDSYGSSPSPVYHRDYSVPSWAQNCNSSVYSPGPTALGPTLQARMLNAVDRSVDVTTLGLSPLEITGPLRRPRRVASDGVRARALARRKPLPKGRKLYHCTVVGCDADFTAKHNLNHHINSHDDFKPHGCEHCGRSFTTSSDRSRHIQKHCPVLKTTKVAA
ncbi:hypothetical protein PM082_022563 [Marasmius tenuissimus]|nr:hypothetical protein PM082_022563 [Marasmius tenuissimus]